nr:PREDICTED: uncharacterized protein LOC109037231 isoform X2 [Bemisia tabaci]
MKLLNLKVKATLLDAPKNVQHPMAWSASKDYSQHHVSLPFPPSVNHYCYHAKSRHFITKEGRQYRNAVTTEVLRLELAVRHRGKIGMKLVAHPPDRRRRDLDNLLKAPLDALQHSGIYEDDNQIDDLHIVRGEKVDGGRLDVTLTFMDVR